MNKSLNDLWQERPWRTEYYYRLKQGYAEPEARRLADAYVTECEAIIASQTSRLATTTDAA